MSLTGWPSELPIRRDEPLAGRTTFELGGAAEYFLEAEREETLVAALAHARRHGVPVSLLGGGSNSLVPDSGIAGLVVQIRMPGRAYRVRGRDVELVAAAGEVWDALVADAVARGHSGLECLSGIPGSVGATPIQNVGAYGVEVGDVLSSVRVLDRKTLEPTELSPEACAFAYRDSALKRDPERFVVLSVGFRLHAGPPSTPRYAELARALRPDADVATVRATVLALRRAKSMVLDPDDPNRRSAGSFFTNPIVDRAVAESVVRIAHARGFVTDSSAVPRWDVDGGRVKLAAGWLIERSGTAKGERDGNVGVSSAHALALVHHGGGTTTELLAFAERVRARVRDVFGVELEREPVWLGPAR